MPASHTVLMLPGDGIGPEVMTQARRVIDWHNRQGLTEIEIIDGLVGGAAIDAAGTPLPNETLDAARKADAILLGAVGGPKWEGQGTTRRPEAGLLGLRKELGLFANLRPAKVFEALIDASPLKVEVVRGLDILIVRELTGGLYFGEPRGIHDTGDGQRRGVNTMAYESHEIRRVADLAFDLAERRRVRLCSVDKSNVLEVSQLWREEVTRVHQESHRDVELTHMLVDAAAMELVRAPKQFDVIVTSNMFGDILSDESAMLTGSIGMLPSASIGEPDPGTGRRPALYEPVHGSAPDIAGTGQANPIAMLLSLAMMYRTSLNESGIAGNIEEAIANILKKGTRTADIMQPGMAKVSTSVLGDSLLRELERLS